MTMPCSLCGEPRGAPRPEVEGLGASLCVTCLPPDAAAALARSSQPPPKPPGSREHLLAELSEALVEEEPAAPPPPPPPEEEEVPALQDEALPLAALRRCLDEAHPVLVQDFLETLTLEQQAALRAGAVEALEQRLGLGRRSDPERVPAAWDRIERWPPERRQALADHLAGMPSATPVIDWIASLRGPGERDLPRVGLGYEVLRRLGDRVRQIHTRAMFGKALLRAERQRLRAKLARTPDEVARLDALEERITRIDRDQLPVYEGWIQEVADLCDFFEATADLAAETEARGRARRTARRLAHSAAFRDMLEDDDQRFLAEVVVPALGG